MKLHELKTWPEYFQDVIDRKKPFELRSTKDRTFEVGDKLKLREYDPVKQEYTGRSTTVVVTYILGGPMALPGWAVMGIDWEGCLTVDFDDRWTWNPKLHTHVLREGL